MHPWTRTLTLGVKMFVDLEACEVKVFWFFLQKPEIVFVFEDFCVKTLNLTFALTWKHKCTPRPRTRTLSVKMLVDLEACES